MKVLITGAGGYLGRGVVKSFIDYGHEVIAVSRNVSKIDQRARIIAKDIFTLETPFKELGEPDILVHMAWRDGFAHYSDSHIEDLPKHYNFIKKMISGGLKKVCSMGSMHEVGFFEGSINERTPCWPTTPYGISKNALRSLVEGLANKNNIPFLWLRGFYIVGTNPEGASIFSKIAAASEKGEEMFPFTLGYNQYDFIDYDSFCRKVVLAVCQDSIEGIVNICSGYPERLADRVEKFIAENGYGIKLDYGAYPDRPYDSKAVWGDSSKIDAIVQEAIEGQ